MYENLFYFACNLHDWNYKEKNFKNLVSSFNTHVELTKKEQRCLLYISLN